MTTRRITSGQLSKYRNGTVDLAMLGTLWSCVRPRNPVGLTVPWRRGPRQDPSGWLFVGVGEKGFRGEGIDDITVWGLEQILVPGVGFLVVLVGRILAGGLE